MKMHLLDRHAHDKLWLILQVKVNESFKMID